MNTHTMTVNHEIEELEIEFTYWAHEPTTFDHEGCPEQFEFHSIKGLDTGIEYDYENFVDGELEALLKDKANEI